MSIEDFWCDITCYSIQFVSANREFMRFIVAPMWLSEDLLRQYIAESFRKIGRPIKQLEIVEIRDAWYPKEIPIETNLF